MIARTVTVVSLFAMASSYGCAASTVCTVKVPPEYNPQQRAETWCNAALSLLAEGRSQEANACATAALQNASARPPVILRSYDVDRQNLVGTVAFVQWIAVHWNLGGPLSVKVPPNWKQDLKHHFKLISDRSDPVRTGNAELERAVEAVRIGLTAMAHFDPDDELQTYTGLLKHGQELIAPWETEPKTEFHYQMWVLFQATMNAWPYVRDSNMVEVRALCKKLEKVVSWYDDDLKEDAKRAKTACEKWLGDRK